MKMKKVLSLIAVAALIGTTSIAVYAATSGGVSDNLPIEQPEVITAQPTVMNLNMEERLESFKANGTIPEGFLDMFSRFQNGERPDFGGRGFGRGFKGEITDEQRANIQERFNQAISDGKIPAELQEMFNGFLNGEITELTDAQKAEVKSVMETYMKQAMADGKIPAELQEIINGFLNGEVTELTDAQKAEIKSIFESYMTQFMEDGKLPEGLLDMFSNFQNGERPNFGDRGFGRERGFSGDRAELEQFMADGTIPAELQDMINGFFNGEMPNFNGGNFNRGGFRGEMTDEQKAEMQSRMESFGGFSQIFGMFGGR